MPKMPKMPKMRKQGKRTNDENFLNGGPESP
jgi:hypothetical protein